MQISFGDENKRYFIFMNLFQSMMVVCFCVLSVSRWHFVLHVFENGPLSFRAERRNIFVNDVYLAKSKVQKNAIF